MWQLAGGRRSSDVAQRLWLIHHHCLYVHMAGLLVCFCQRWREDIVVVCICRDRRAGHVVFFWAGSRTGVPPRAPEFKTVPRTVSRCQESCHSPLLMALCDSGTFQNCRHYGQAHQLPSVPLLSRLATLPHLSRACVVRSWRFLRPSILTSRIRAACLGCRCCVGWWTGFQSIRTLASISRKGRSLLTGGTLLPSGRTWMSGLDRCHSNLLHEESYSYTYATPYHTISHMLSKDAGA